MSLAGIFFTLSIIFCLISLGWFVLVVAALKREWNDNNDGKLHLLSLWRVIPPLQLLSLFVPQLFAPSLGFRSIWFLFGYLTFIAITFIPYFIDRKIEQRRTARENLAMRESRQPLVEPVRINLAATKAEFAGAGEIFAQVFGHNFDQIFGRHRAKNACLISELLELKKGEVHIALDGRNRVVGAMWLGLGNPDTQLPTFKKLWPILNHYLDPFNALYGALVGVPAMMAQESTKKRAYIYWLGVAPEAQGQGVGLLLLKYAEELAQHNGNKELQLHTESNNSGARKLYHHFGMREGLVLPIWPRVRFDKKL
jgi:ribosomal protein S18 acetylase RimI-like enzyme